ncbi:MAG: helix-turn-helix transcriptional regulator [Bacteroidales bacterium]
MSNDSEIKRLPRLTSILIKLQSKRLVTAQELADKFSVSRRTIYRDMRALEEAGVPIITQEGKGYILQDGYRIPPVMFSENEAKALVTAEKLVINNEDTTFVKHYSDAVAKIKALLGYEVRDKMNFLSERLLFGNYRESNHQTHNLNIIQSAIIDFHCIEIDYMSEKKESTQRIIEPFALYHTQSHWVLIAFCRLRNEFRSFRLDRIVNLKNLYITFEPHNLTLQEYYEKYMMKKNEPLT